MGESAATTSGMVFIISSCKEGLISTNNGKTDSIGKNDSAECRGLMSLASIKNSSYAPF
jgi:hypothetical protein